MMLFICYASEDRDDFVRPLAEALSKEYEKITLAQAEPKGLCQFCLACYFS